MTDVLSEVSTRRSSHKVESNRHRRRAQAVLIELWLPLLIVLALIIWTSSAESLYVPPFTDVVQAMITVWMGEYLVSDIVPSLIRFTVGAGIAAVIGVVGGVIVGSWRPLRRAVSPIVDFFRTLPAPALLPVGLALLGVGNEMKIGIIAFISLFPVLLNTIDGVAGIDMLLRDTCRAYGIRGRRRLTLVVLPAASPQIFTGFRVASALALVMMVYSEMVASTDGIGYQILLAQRGYDMVAMWSGVLLLGVFGYALNGLLQLAERTVLAWHRASRGYGTK